MAFGLVSAPAGRLQNVKLPLEATGPQISAPSDVSPLPCVSPPLPPECPCQSASPTQIWSGTARSSSWTAAFPLSAREWEPWWPLTDLTISPGRWPTWERSKHCPRPCGPHGCVGVCVCVGIAALLFPLCLSIGHASWACQELEAKRSSVLSLGKGTLIFSPSLFSHFTFLF